MSTNARHLKAHVHKKGHFCGIRRDPILWSKDQRRKKLSKKWFHGSKKDQKKLSNETQIRQHYNIIIGVERQKKSWHNDFLPIFFKKTPSFENRYIYTSWPWSTSATHLFKYSPESNLLLAFSNLVHHQLEQISSSALNFAMRHNPSTVINQKRIEFESI